jgi:hypothetical protein
MKNIILILIILFISSCESIDREIELPLPEIFITSTLTDATETEVKVRGQIDNIRDLSTDVYGVVYSEKPNPTIESGKVTISGNKGPFDVTIRNLKAKTNYYFRAFLQTPRQTYYTNELISSQLEDKRWQRREDFPDKMPFFTGLLIQGDENYPFVINGEIKDEEAVPFSFGYNYLGDNNFKLEWYQNKNLRIKNLFGLQNLFIVNPSPDRTFFGGGFTVNSNLPTPKIYSTKLWYILEYFKGTFYLPIPFEGESAGMTIGQRMYIMSTASNGELYEFSNLEYDPRKNNTFKNLGRVITTGTPTKGYVMSESTNPKIKGGLFYDYDPVADKWTAKKPFAGTERNDGMMFSIRGRVFYGLGLDKNTRNALKDIWEYIPNTDQWQLATTYPGNGNIQLLQSVYSGAIYMGMGYQTSINVITGFEFSGVKDFWSFRP